MPKVHTLSAAEGSKSHSFASKSVITTSIQAVSVNIVQFCCSLSSFNFVLKYRPIIGLTVPWCSPFWLVEVAGFCLAADALAGCPVCFVNACYVFFLFLLVFFLGSPGSPFLYVSLPSAYVRFGLSDTEGSVMKTDPHTEIYLNLFEPIDMKWHDMIWSLIICFDMVCYDMIWHELAWYGMVWYDGTSESIQNRLIVCLDLVALQVKFTLKHLFLAASRLLTKHWQLASICSIYKYASYKII